MPTYPVNPSDPTSPTDFQGAKQGAEEFRALKALIASMVVANSASSGPRQAIQSAVLDANGYNNTLTTGAGLRPGLTASVIDPLHLSTANGFTNGKAINNEESIVVNIADILGVDLPLNNSSYLYRNYGANYDATLIPPQYGYTFDKTKGALLNFEAADTSVVMNDDFGNTWTATNQAQIDTAQFKFGTSSLLLDGTTDYITSINITTLGDGSFELAGWFRLNALPGAAARAVLLHWTNAGSFGVQLQLFNNAGITKLEINLSSNGTGHDIAVAVVGANTVWALNQWHKYRLVFDSLVGTYRVYLSLNAAAETQDINVVSALKICAITQARYGAAYDGSSGFNGWLDAHRFLPCATKTTTENPAAVAPTIIDYKVNFFSIPKMQMFEVTAASVGAGVNPTLTSVLRLFLGEADTSGVAVTTVRNYAVRGEFIDTWTLTGVGPAIVVTRSHKIGIMPDEIPVVEYECITADAGYIVGDRISIPYGVDAGPVSYPLTVIRTKNICGFTSGVVNSPQAVNRASGARATLTGTAWKYRVNVKRGW